MENKFVKQSETYSLQVENQPESCGCENNKSIKSVWRDFLDMARFTALILVVYYLLSLFLFQFNTVDGASMYPTMDGGDRIVVNKISLLIGSDLKRGDIITIRGSKVPSGRIEKDVIKRVIGLPGDQISVEDGYVYLNGEKLDEPYLENPGLTYPVQPSYAEVTLGENEYYVLGDNRLHSADSRSFGVVPREAIMGSVLFRFYPFSKLGRVQ